MSASAPTRPDELYKKGQASRCPERARISWGKAIAGSGVRGTDLSRSGQRCIDTPCLCNVQLGSYRPGADPRGCSFRCLAKTTYIGPPPSRRHSLRRRLRVRASQLPKAHFRWEAARSRLAAGKFEASGGTVDRLDGKAALVEEQRVPAYAATEVEHMCCA